MEFKEYLRVIKKYRKVFFGVWGSILFLALFTVAVQPIVYEGEMTAMIVRENKSSEVKVFEEYDYYYQLEADKKFAEILVQFLDDKAVLNRSFKVKVDGHKTAILKKEVDWVSSKIKGEVLGAGYIKIWISSHEEELIKQISNGLTEQLNSKISKMEVDEKSLLSLEVEPVIVVQKGKLYLPVGLGAFFGGLLMAIFVVLGVHYWKED